MEKNETLQFFIELFKTNYKYIENENYRNRVCEISDDLSDADSVGHLCIILAYLIRDRFIVLEDVEKLLLNDIYGFIIEDDIGIFRWNYLWNYFNKIDISNIIIGINMIYSRYKNERD